MADTAKKVADEKRDKDGYFYEPRIYYSYFPFDGTLQTLHVWSDPRAYWNGEQFPVQITHLTAAVVPGGSLTNPTSNIPPGDPRALQFYGIRVMDHDTYYPSGLSTNIPHLHNQPTTVAPNVSRGTAVWEFEKPFILSSWDAINAEGVFGQNFSSPGVTIGNIFTSISFDGYGLFSKRAYRLGDTHLVDSNNSVPPFRWNPQNLRNEGAEPIVITRMQVTALGTTANSAALNISFLSFLRIRIRIDGNGTTGHWGVEPAVPARDPNNIPLIWTPAQLFGVNSFTGTVSHKIPGGGWTFEPGEGVVIELSALYGDPSLFPPYVSAFASPPVPIVPAPDRKETLVVALCGHIIGH